MSAIVRIRRKVKAKSGSYFYILSIFILLAIISILVIINQNDHTGTKSVPLAQPNWKIETLTKTRPNNPTSAIQYIKDHHLTPPSKDPYPAELRGAYANGYSLFIEKLFRNKGRNYKGVFVEAGAYDGAAASNTLYLEKRLGWTGLLVECNPLLLPKLRAKNRKAWIADVCLSPHSTPTKMNFTTLQEWPASAKLGEPLNLEEMKKFGIDWVSNKTWINYEITCYPLYSILSAVGEWSSLDFLSLDVEGAEIGILKNFPFDLFPIKVLIVEVHTFTEDQKEELHRLMSENEYLLREKWEMDEVYVHKSQGDILGN